MEDNVLKRMSEDVLVIPFSNEIVEKLEEFCSVQADNINYEKLSKLTICFIAKIFNENLHKDLVQYIEKHEILRGLPIKVLEPIIAEYIVLLSINKTESDFKRTIYSLMVKNSVFLVVKGYGYLTYPQAVIDTYDLFLTHIEENKTFKSENTINLIDEFLNTDIDKSNYSFAAKEKKAELKAVFYDAARYRYDNLVNRLANQVIEGDIYLKAYKIIKSLIENTPWIYIDKHPERTIKILMQKLAPKGTQRKLANIITVISENNEFNRDYDHTSVLLNVMAGKTYYTQVWNNSAELTLAEFAIYLYYELLTEKLLMIAIDLKKKEEVTNEQ